MTAIVTASGTAAHRIRRLLRTLNLSQKQPWNECSVYIALGERPRPFAASGRIGITAKRENAGPGMMPNPAFLIRRSCEDGGSADQWNESPQAQLPAALGLSMVKPCFWMVSSKSIEAPSR
ncbi:hypothetical protein L3i23_12000 [Herbiconiux sp. L3-i23]|nr:hypothetical protein L3i23_12000 [Herbiconiux sp. L3-i23]